MTTLRLILRSPLARAVAAAVLGVLLESLVGRRNAKEKS
jgi:hypothetical protein